MKALSVFSILIVIAALSLLFRLAERIEEENRMLESGFETLRIYNEILHSKIDEIRRFRHDAAGLLQAIDSSEPDDGSEAEDCKTLLQSGDTAAKAAMPLLDAIIELKKRQCAEAGIEFECPDSLIPSCGSASADNDPACAVTLPDEADLCLLVQNLLDNAYEANLRIEDGAQRMMSLDAEVVQMTKGSEAAREGRGTAAMPEKSDASAQLVISVTNRICEEEKVSFITRKNRPELHGIGLRIVDDILKKYNGRRSVSTDHENHLLSVMAELHLPADDL